VKWGVGTVTIPEPKLHFRSSFGVKTETEFRSVSNRMFKLAQEVYIFETVFAVMKRGEWDVQ